MTVVKLLSCCICLLLFGFEWVGIIVVQWVVFLIVWVGVC